MQEVDALYVGGSTSPVAYAVQRSTSKVWWTTLDEFSGWGRSTFDEQYLLTRSYLRPICLNNIKIKVGHE